MATYHQAGCCCAECEYCNDDPASITLVLSDIVTCTECVNNKYKWITVPSIGPNGTFSLSKTSPCLYEYNAACTGELGYYYVDSCGDGDLYKSPDIIAIWIRAYATVGGIWQVLSAYSTAGEAHVYPMFNDDSARADGGMDCEATHNLTNDITVCTETSNVKYMFRDGTGTLTPVMPS